MVISITFVDNTTTRVGIQSLWRNTTPRLRVSPIAIRTKYEITLKFKFRPIVLVFIRSGRLFKVHVFDSITAKHYEFPFHSFWQTTPRAAQTPTRSTAMCKHVLLCVCVCVYWDRRCQQITTINTRKTRFGFLIVQL